MSNLDRAIASPTLARARGADLSSTAPALGAADAATTRLGHAAFLEELRRQLAAALVGADARALALALAPEAKRVRPLLLLELASALGVAADSVVLVRAAAAVELIHTASLVHDDVVDMAESRRGLPSVNAALGNPAAVLVGDELLCRALELVDSTMVFTCIKAVATMTRGALREIAAQGDLDLDDESWQQIAGAKTGALFGLCGSLAALVANDDARVKRFTDAARALGVAFQAADDVVDLANGGDLDEKNPNIAVLHASRFDRALRDALLRAWARPRLPNDERAALVRGVLAARGHHAAIAVAQAALMRASDTFDTDATSAGVKRALAAGEGYIALARAAL